jgi:hypothetical protein
MSVVFHIHKKYICGTQKKAFVQSLNVLLCHLTAAVVRGSTMTCNKVYLGTRVLKHVYDKRPAEEFDFLLLHLSTIVKYPDRVYENKMGKRGRYCFIKTIKNHLCLVSIETVEDDGKASHCEVATFFRTKENYLCNYKLLWEWKGGTPPS